MRFKQWLENLAGPGGGPDFKAANPEDIPKADAKKGVGAFPTYNKDDPPAPPVSPTRRYLDPRFAKMRKK